MLFLLDLLLVPLIRTCRNSFSFTTTWLARRLQFGNCLISRQIFPLLTNKFT